MSDITCPWCFGVFKDIRVQFRCINPGCSREPDELHAKYYNLSRPELLPVVIDPEEGFISNLLGREFDRVECPKCSVETYKKICPLCHNELPGTCGEFRHYIFSVVGSKESGKSHFIATLLDKLKHGVGDALDASLSALNDETIKRYTREFYEPIYKEGVVLDATRSLSSHREGKVPMIFCLKIREKGRLGDNFKVVILVFFDTAGEDLDNTDLISVEAKYIGRSDGIIFLVDPLQIREIREKVGDSVTLPDEHTEPDTVVNNIARVIRGVNHVEIKKRIQIPFAVTLSKFDAVKPLLPRSSDLLSPSSHGRTFDCNEFERTSSEIKALLRKWTEDSGALERDVEHNFEDYGYFVTSSLGSSPDREGRLKVGVNPVRVADPFLWLLWKHGIIQGEE